MPITVDWYNAEKTALLYIYDGRWTWNEFDDAVAQGNALMQSVPYMVHVVLDLQAISVSLTDVISVKNREHITNLTSPKQGKLILHKINPALQFVASTVQRIAPVWVASRNMVFTNNREEIEDALASEEVF